MTRTWLDRPGRTARYIDVNPGRHFSSVTLNRDALCFYGAAEGRDAERELRAGFADAARKCIDAAASYLWAHGYSGDVMCLTGPNFVTLPVPFELAEDATEALRIAEQDGDFTGLRTLTARLAIPLERWLAPGERELRQGVDFVAAPTTFLAFLRAAAKSRGIRLNGRAVPGAVWVRPQTAEDHARPAGTQDHQGAEDLPRRPYVGARGDSCRRRVETDPLTTDWG